MSAQQLASPTRFGSNMAMAWVQKIGIRNRH